MRATKSISPSSNRQTCAFLPKAPHIPSISSLVNITHVIDAAVSKP